MSQEHVEIVQRGLGFLGESYESGEATDQLLDLCAPEIRVDASRRVFNPGVYEGHQGVRRSIQEICNAWEDFQASNEQVIDAGDRVVVIQTISGRGRASKALVQQRGALIVTVQDGLLQLIEVFTNDSEALKAVGLEG